MRWVVWALPLLWLLPASALMGHELDINTARVTLRDGNIECRLDVNLSEWHRLSIEAGVIPKDLPAPEVQRSLQVRLIEGVRLWVNEEPTRFTNLRVQPMEEGAAGHHGPRTTILLDTRSPTDDPERIALELPEALGPTLVNFVQPETRWTAPGGLNTFEVLKPRPRPTEVAPTGGGEDALSHGRLWLLAGLALGGALGFGLGRYSQGGADDADGT